MAETAQDHKLPRRFGSFEINLLSRELRKNGIRLRLSGQPFQVLAVLIERAGEVVTREELHSKLWPAETFVDFDHGLNNAVARIREVLEDSRTTPRYVETLPRRGYRFLADVMPVRPMLETPPPRPEPVSPVPMSIAEEPLPPPAVPASEKPAYRRIMLWLALAAGAVAVASFVVFLYSTLTHPGRQRIRSLAVLPLKNLSADPTQEYLADGMTEELIGRLAGIHNLRVISRTSVMRFKKVSLPASEIAKMLNVDALVEGSIARQGSRLRIHAQLIRAATDDHFWSESYDRELGDVLSLQGEVARDVAEKVRVTVSGQEHSRLSASRRVSPEVYEIYLKGEFGEHNSRSQLEESVRYFQDAIAKDSTFAPAYLGLAKAYSQLGTIVVGASPAEMRPKVVNSAQKAIELDPDLAEAHAILAGVYQRRWQWSEAKSEFNRALQLKPNDAAARVGFASWLVCKGQTEEAVTWALQTRELDPLGDTGLGIADILFFARRYDEAIREIHAVLAVHPDSALAHWSMGRTLIGKGEAQAAVSELEKTASLMQRAPGSLEMLATAYAHVGRRSEALSLLRELKKRQTNSYVPAGAFINPNLGLRDYNEALAWFERAYAEQSNILQFVKVHPFFDPIRDDPRFKDLVHRVGL